MKIFSGSKTYIAAALAIGIAIMAWYSGEYSTHMTVQAVFLALGLGTVRWNVELTEFVAGLIRLESLRQSDTVARYSTYGTQLITVLTSILAIADGSQTFLAGAQVIAGALGISFLGAGVGKAHSAATQTDPAAPT